MANDVDIQTRTTGILLTPFSDKSTISEIIEGVKSLEAGNLRISENPQLVFEIRKLLSFYDKKINISEEKDILEFLSNLPIKEVSVEEIIGEKAETPETKLSQSEIKALVEEYETATLERQKEIDNKLKPVPDVRKNLQDAIKRQQEIAREQAFLEKQNLEKLDDKKEIERIVKTEKVSREEARIILDEAKMAESQVIVDSFAESVMENTKTNEYKNIIKNEISKVVSGEEASLNLPKGLDPVIAKRIGIETERFVNKEHPSAAKNYQLNKIKEQFDIAAANAPTEQEKGQVREYQELIIKFHDVGGPKILTDKSRKDVETKLELQGKSPGEINTALHNVDTTLKSIQHSPDQFKKIVEKAKSLSGLSRKLLPNSAMVRSFDNLMSNAARNPVIINLQRMANLKVEVLNFATKIPGVNTLLVGAGETLGFAAAKDFILLSTQIMAEQGSIPGAIAILKAITTGAGVLESGAVGVEGISTLSAALGAFQGVPGLGQILLIVTMLIMAGIWIYNHIIKPIFESVNNFLKNNFNLNLNAVKDFVADHLHLGKFAGTVAQFGFNALMGVGAVIAWGMAALFGPILAVGLASMTALITPVVIFFAVGMLSYNLLVDMPKISSLVPPPPEGAGGTCQPKEDEGEPAISDGEINCNQNAPEANIGISKEDFGKFADDWNRIIGGKHYARECFNDVVNRAKCAGIVPEYALWAWLHESGASNYSIANVEDFGIHGQSSAPPKNFDKQITKFLTLDPATVCINDPRVGGNYWLAFSINYLLGDDPADPSNTCNPDRVNSQGNTGRKYEAELRESWSRLGSPPATIHGPKGGQNCGGNANNLVAEGENEFVVADGTVMVCSGPVDENGNFIGLPGESKYDPNAPGLVGELIPGVSCSVADKVVSTKQCGQSWSNKALPGGSGTICSAGCGPSSTSSILRNINGSLTPDTLIFEDGSPYNGMNGNGSSLGQAHDSLVKHGMGGAVGSVGGCSQQAIVGWLRQGRAVIFLADSYTGSGGGTIGHILVAEGVDSSGIIYTKDPYYSNRTPFVTSGGIKAGQIKTLRECLPVTLGKQC